MGVCCSRKRTEVVKSVGHFEPTSYGDPGLRRRERETDDKTELPLRDFCYIKMANAISNIKMTNPIKNLVSKKRRRYVQDGYNLDLTYIRSDLIAMGFPAEKLEGVYRNHIDDVVKFLESKHKDHYRIYNLCSERTYDDKKFQSRVASYPFDDHNPPKIELIAPFCTDVHSWLAQDDKNVAVVHCKAGKGRTGVMICCYLLHCNDFPSAERALDYYGQKRTEDRKGVTIPSQRRYVGYYEHLLRNNVKYEATTLRLWKVLVTHPVNFTPQVCYQLVVSCGEGRTQISPVSSDVQRSTDHLIFSVENDVILTGDIKVEFINKAKMKRKEKMLHFWFNTFFVCERPAEVQLSNGNEEAAADRSQRARSYDATGSGPLLTDAPHRRTPRSTSLTSVDQSRPFVLRLRKHELDKANKDKQDKVYPPGFEVNLYFYKISGVYPDKARPAAPSLPQHSPSDSEESEDGDWDGWDSGETTYL